MSDDPEQRPHATPGVARVTVRHRGAFIFRPESLRAFDGIVSRFLGDAACTDFQVFSRGIAPQRFGSMQAVLELRNPRTAPIEVILITGRAGSSSATLALDTRGQDRCACVVFYGHSEDQERLATAASEVDREARNDRAWYWWVRWPFDTLQDGSSRAPAWLRVVGVIAWAVALLNLLWGVFKYFWQASSDGSPLVHAPRPSAVHPAWLIMPLAVGLLAPFAFSWIFPRAVFEIGDGKHRNDQLGKVRNFVLGTVIVGGIVLRAVWAWAVG